MKLKKNDKRAKLLIFLLSVIVFAAVTFLSQVKLDVDLGFDKHIFAQINAIINGTVSFLLVAGLIAIKMKKRKGHERIMLTAIILSTLFLISYICHHLFTGSTPFGDADHDGVASASEIAAVGPMRLVYFLILITHIFLAAIILPFILFTAYRALISEYPQHKKLAKITWPVWLYVSVTGVVVYLLISPYYT